MARRVLVCGGRDFNNKKLLYRVLDASHKSNPIAVIISGMAAGTDSLAVEWAQSRGVKLLPFPANWAKHGRSAGPIRNQQMLDEGRPDVVYAFPGGVGTKDMCQRAYKVKITVLKIHDAKR